MTCDVVTLNNGKKYYLLLEKHINGKKYYLAELDGDSKKNDESVFFELCKKNNKEYLKVVTDKETIEILLLLFTKDYIEYTEKLGGKK